MDRLGIDRPDIAPKATEHIGEMITLIEELIDQGKAYPSEGDVYYIVDSFPEYGKLSKRNIDDMQAGARISVNEQKRHPMDFVLWKGSKPGEPTWDSPWGPGRPGWHIECSAMSRKYLGETFDIHGGGQDLIFPHHENEIAQSEGANHKPFVNYWIHHGFVTIRDEKMSKSLGNFLTIRDILNHYHPEILRFFIFSTHYRNPLDFSESAMQDATAGLERLYECVAAIDALKPQTRDGCTKCVCPKKIYSNLTASNRAFNRPWTMTSIPLRRREFSLIQSRPSTEFVVNYRRHPPPMIFVLLKNSVATLKKLANIMGLLRGRRRAVSRREKSQNGF